MAFPKGIEDAFRLIMDAAKSCDLLVTQVSDKDGNKHFVLAAQSGCDCQHHQKSVMPLAIIRDDLCEFLVQPNGQMECLGAIPNTPKPSSEQVSRMFDSMLQDAMRGKPPAVN